MRLSPNLLAHYAALGAPNPRRYCHFHFPRNLERFYGAAHLPERSTALSPLLRPLRFPDSIPSARDQRWHRDVNGGLAPDDAAGNRNLLFRPTLLSPRYYIDGNEGIIERYSPETQFPILPPRFRCRRDVIANAGNGFRSATKH